MGRCTKVDQNLIAEKAKYLQKDEENNKKVDLSHFNFFNIMPYFIYTDLISNLLDPRLVDPGSTLIHVGTYDQL